VGGLAGYAFRVTATDAPDSFRIRIWKKSGGEVVYDNANSPRLSGVLTIGDHTH
jgi:hypothetical protein